MIYNRHAHFHKRSLPFLLGILILLSAIVLLATSSLVHADGFPSAVRYAGAINRRTTIRADGFPIIGVLRSGRGPEAMAVDTQTHLLYIAHESHGLVVAFDAIRGKVIWRVEVGDVATDVQVDSTSHLVFVTSVSYRQQESNLLVLSGRTGETVAKVQTGFGDNGIALDAARHRVYVSSEGVIYELTTMGRWQDTSTAFQNAVISQLHIGTHPQGLGVNTRLGRLYVADVAEHVLRVVDETTMHVLATIPLAATPLNPLRVDEVTSYVYIVCSTGQELDVVDGNKNSVIARVPVAPYPEGIATDTATGRIYIADEGNNEQNNSNNSKGNTITVLDGKTFELLGTLQVGLAPDGVAADAALHRVYVALENSNAIVEVSDSVNLPLKVSATRYQAVDARRAVGLLQQASILTALFMLVTVVVATYATYVRNRKGRTASQVPAREMESPQTVPDDASSHADSRSLRL